MHDFTRLNRQPSDLSIKAYNFDQFSTHSPADADGFEIEEKTLYSGIPIDKKIPIKSINIMDLQAEIQGTFFDLYGTNLSQEDEETVLENLPNEVLNNVDAFKTMLTNVLIQLKAYEWVRDIKDQTVNTTQEIFQQIDEIVDSGRIEDIDTSKMEDVLEEDSDEEIGDDEDLVSKANIVQDKIDKSRDSDRDLDKGFNLSKAQGYTPLGLPIIACDNI